jgi:hypothetical protein
MAWVNYLTEVFRREGYRLRPLLARIAESPNFYAVELPVVQTAAAHEETHR